MLDETSAFIAPCILSVGAVRCHSSCMEDGRAIQLLSSGAVVALGETERQCICVCVCVFFFFCDQLEQ